MCQNDQRDYVRQYTLYRRVVEEQTSVLIIVCRSLLHQKTVLEASDWVVRVNLAAERVWIIDRVVGQIIHVHVHVRVFCWGSAN